MVPFETQLSPAGETWLPTPSSKFIPGLMIKWKRLMLNSIVYYILVFHHLYIYLLPILFWPMVKTKRCHGQKHVFFFNVSHKSGCSSTHSEWFLSPFWMKFVWGIPSWMPCWEPSFKCNRWFWVRLLLKGRRLGVSSAWLGHLLGIAIHRAYGSYHDCLSW